MRAAVREALASAGADPDSAAFHRTPDRVADSAELLLSGEGKDAATPLIDGRFAVSEAGIEAGTASGAGRSRDLVELNRIPFVSTCLHHLTPFEGTIDISFEPGEWLVGFTRVLDTVRIATHRLTLQETVADQLADAVMAGLQARGVRVRVSATHGCVSARAGRASTVELGEVVTTTSRGSLAEAGRAARSVPSDRDEDALRPAAPLTSAVLGHDDHVGFPEPTRIMGILNVTPDSFSDGGRFERGDDAERTSAAVAEAERMIEAGASIIDVGGESTRPGAERVEEADELARVVPVVRALAERGITVSVDTMRASVAKASLSAGARIINDVSGGLADEAMLPLIAATDCDYVLSHWRGHSIDMNERATYASAADEVLAELLTMRDRALEQGIAPERIVLDPGLGFAKNAEHNWAILRELPRLVEAGHRVLIGASRKRFVGEIAGEEAPVTDRDLPTAVISALCAQHGVWGVRVHDVRATRMALDVVSAWQAGGARGVTVSGRRRPDERHPGGFRPDRLRTPEARQE